MFRVIFLSIFFADVVCGTPNDLLRFGVFCNETRSVDVALMQGAYADVSVFGIPVLLYAAQHGYSDVIRSLLEYDIDVNVRGSNGQTALIEAVKGGHGGTVQLLLMTEIDLHISDDAGFTALDYAYIAEQSIMIAHILRAGFEVPRAFYGERIAMQYDRVIQDFEKCKIIYLDCLHHLHDSLLDVWVKNLPHLLRIRDHLGETILHKAIRLENADVCRKILLLNPYLGRFHNNRGLSALDSRFLMLARSERNDCVYQDDD